MDSTSPSQEPPSQRLSDGDHPLTRRLVIAGFSALLLLPLAMYGCGPEWARWDAAQAVIAYDRGDMEQAIFQLTTAVERSPRDPSLKISLAKKLIESGRGKEAEALCDEILERYPDNAPALITKANSQQSQGNFRLALNTFNARARHRNWTIGRRPDKLNERAYFRALAGVQLEDAKQDIDIACAIISQSRFGNLPWSLELLERSLAACTIVAMKIDTIQLPLPHLSAAIDRLRRTLHESHTELNRQIIELTATEYPPDQEDANVPNNFRAMIDNREKTLATLLTIRALAYQQIGADDLCDQDRDEVRRLDFDSDEIAAGLPTGTQSIDTIQISSAFLDTRGYITGIMPADNSPRIEETSNGVIGIGGDFQEALRDLDQSILAFEVFEKSLITSIHNHAEGSVQDPIALLKSIGKQKAVLIYHRMAVRKKSGDKKGAATDAATIKSLGCEPGPHLF